MNKYISNEQGAFYDAEKIEVDLLYQNYASKVDYYCSKIGQPIL